jgi:hypothetical protein
VYHFVLLDGIKCATFKTRTSRRRIETPEEILEIELKAENELNSQEYENTF